MESLKRWREPAAWLILGVLAIGAGLGLVALLQAGRGAATAETLQLGGRVANPALFVVLTALLADCVLSQPIRRARALLLAGTVAEGAALLVGGTLVGIGFTASAGAISGLVGGLQLVVSALAFAVLVALPGARTAETPAEPEALSAAPSPDEPAPDRVDPQLQPAWPPDAAAGAVWLSAGAAAAGAPATGWGTEAESPSGWQPLPATGDPEAEPPATGRFDQPAARPPVDPG